MGGDQRDRRSQQLGGHRFVGGQLAADNFRKDVLEGLARPQKALPPKYFYDAAGSRLFEQICRLREYYPTRTELGITRRHLNDIARFVGKRCALLEYGSGESLKTRLLIRALQPSVYMPVDISTDALRGAVKRLGREFPQLGIVAITADFSNPLTVPAYRGNARRVVYFPGSTIGNLRRDEAQAFLKMTRGQVGPRGAMLVGVDLKKDANVLHAAYNDAKGVTADFNL
ncbi:MAG TPA: L-histidine N(alpha)-methyltransferase, partial [Burkholderiales bacterium]|nr:L-histidine N(alpha)-methyltransferase [Burkholderiales bacterium]